MADFQALMWFHEKSLFKDLGIAQGGGRENDYVDGAIAVLREEGITDDNIQEALPTTDSFPVTISLGRLLLALGTLGFFH